MAGFITNCDKRYYKLRQLWRQKVLQNAPGITNCDKKYYKMRQVLQIATNRLQIASGITNCEVITNCDSTNVYLTKELLQYMYYMYVKAP